MQPKYLLTKTTKTQLRLNLLLTSDLRGSIEKPNYYFTSHNTNADADLDVLLLTQGYHRFEWQQLLSDKFSAVKYPAEKRMSLSGIIKKQNSNPVPYAKVSLLSTGKINFFADTIANADGKFSFDQLPNRDSMHYVVQATDKVMRQNTIIVSGDLKPYTINHSRENADSFDTLNKSLAAFYKYSVAFHHAQMQQGFGKEGVMLKEVVVKEEKEPAKYLKHSANLNGAGNANDVITADQLPIGCPVFTDCIVGRLHGIKFINGALYYEGAPVLVVIDGVEIADGMLGGALMMGVKSKTVFRL